MRTGGGIFALLAWFASSSACGSKSARVDAAADAGPADTVVVDVPSDVGADTMSDGLDSLVDQAADAGDAADGLRDTADTSAADAPDASDAATPFVHLLWAQAITSPGWDDPRAVAAIPGGGFYVAGAQSYTFPPESGVYPGPTFAPGTANETTLTGSGAFFARYRSDGTLVWARPFDGGSPERVIATADGFVVVGLPGADPTFGKGQPHETTLIQPAGAGGGIFAARFLDDGTLVWAAGFYSDQQLYADPVALLPDGGVIVASGFVGSVTFAAGTSKETTVGSPGSTAGGIFVAAYSIDGQLNWVKSASGQAGLRAAAGGPDGTVWVTGRFTGAITLGLGESKQATLTSTGSDGLLANFAGGDGSFLGARTIAGSGDESGVDVAVLPDGQLYTFGQFSQTLVLGDGASRVNLPRQTSAVQSMFLAAFASDGTLHWAHRVDADADAIIPYRLGVAADGGAFVAGHSGAKLSFEGLGTVTAADKNDAFIARYAPSGAWSYATMAQANSNGGAGDMAALADGPAIVLGNFVGTGSFGAGEPRARTLTSCCQLEPDGFLAAYAP